MRKDEEYRLSEAQCFKCIVHSASSSGPMFLNNARQQMFCPLYACAAALRWYGGSEFMYSQISSAVGSVGETPSGRGGNEASRPRGGSVVKVCFFGTGGKTCSFGFGGLSFFQCR